MTDLNVIVKALLAFVDATYIDTLFFGYFSSVVGDTVFAVVLNSTSFILSCRRRDVEITHNDLLLKLILNIIRPPLLLNGP